MCVQLQVGGSGSGTPQSTVSFPGAYNDNDPGIYDPDVRYRCCAVANPHTYTNYFPAVQIYNPGSNYTFPGGPISNLAASAQSLAPGESTMPPFPSGTSVTNAPAQPTQTESQGGNPSPSALSSAGSQQISSSAPMQAEPTGATDPSGSGTGSCMLKARSNTGNQRRHFKRFIKRIMPHASH